MLTCVDTSIHIWESPASEQPEQIKVPLPYISSCKYLSDNRTLVTVGKSSTIYFTDIYTRIQRQFEVEGSQQLSFVTSTKDGNNVAIGTKDGRILILVYPQFKIIKQYKAHDFPIVSMEYTKDEKSLISADNHGHICISSDGKVEPLFKNGARNGVIHNFSISASGESLAICSGKSLRIYDMETKDMRFIHDIGANATVNFSTVQENVAVIGTSYGDVQIFDTNQGSVVLEHHAKKPIFTTAMKYDGYTYAAGYAGGVMLFDLRKTGQTLIDLPTSKCVAPSQIVFQSADISQQIADEGLQLKKKETQLRSISTIEETFDDGDYSQQKFTFRRSIQEINESKSRISGFISPSKTKSGISGVSTRSIHNSTLLSGSSFKSRSVSITAPEVPLRSKASQSELNESQAHSQSQSQNPEERKEKKREIDLYDDQGSMSDVFSPIKSEAKPKKEEIKKKEEAKTPKKTEVSISGDEDDSDIIQIDELDSSNSDEEDAISPQLKTVIKVKKDAQKHCEEAAAKKD